MASKKQQQSRLDAMKPRVKPVDLFSSLKLELSALIVIATAIAFAMCWFLLKFGWSGWIAMPLTLVVALGITYFFSRGITAPLRQMRDVAEAMADGDYTVRVDIDQDRHDEVGKLARSFNEMAGELEHADKMRRDMIANVSHELRTPVSALQAMVENMADGVTEPTPTNLESILTQTQRLSDLIAFLLDLSRMEAGAASLNIEKFNFADFLDETIEPLEIADGGHAHDKMCIRDRTDTGQPTAADRAASASARRVPIFGRLPMIATEADAGVYPLDARCATTSCNISMPCIPAPCASAPTPNSEPMSPNRAAASNASIRACAATSPSESPSIPSYLAASASLHESGTGQ